MTDFFDRVRSSLPGRMIGRFIDWVRSAYPRRIPTASLDEDVAFDALANERRRHVLRIVAARDDGIDTTDLADEVAVAETDVDAAEDLSSDQSKRVYVSLYQTNLPKLAKLGLVEYDTAEGIVRPVPETAAAARTLDDVGVRIDREVID